MGSCLSLCQASCPGQGAESQVWGLVPRIRGTARGEGRVLSDSQVETDPVHHIPVSDAGVWIGESERAAGSRRSKRIVRGTKDGYIGLGLQKPREKNVSTCNTLSRNPLVGGIAGSFRASRVLGVNPIPNRRWRRCHTVWRSTARCRCRCRRASRHPSSSRLKCAGSLIPLAMVTDRPVRPNGLSDAGDKSVAATLRCSSSLAGTSVQVRHAVAVHRGWQSDIEIQAEWFGDLFGEELAERRPEGSARRISSPSYQPSVMTW